MATTHGNPDVQFKHTKDSLPQLEAALRALADRRLMVGIPAVAASRPGSPLNNAEIGYIQEFGAPEAHIPPRPHLGPTARRLRPYFVEQLRLAGARAVRGNLGALEQRLEIIGLRAVAEVKSTIRANVPPPLAASTVEQRILRRKSKAYRKKKRAAVQANLDAGFAPGAGIFTALIDTGNYLGRITYVVRLLKSGRDVKTGNFKP